MVVAKHVGILTSLVLLASSPLSSGCTTTATQRLALGPLPTAQHVDLHRYLGTWYEIASFPQRFQKGCVATQATYSLREDGRIAVHNVCHDKTFTGAVRQADGQARVADPNDASKLEVSFFRPFWADYWIIEVAPDYSHAVVGHPSRDYLWILARNTVLPDATYRSILARLAALGFELDRLQKTPQVPNQN